MKIYLEYLDDFSLEELLDSSSKSRIEKAMKYSNPKAQIRTLLGEHLLKKGLDELGVPFEGIKELDNGKPYIDNKNLFFNISHSDNVVVVAVSEKEIGVDIEKIKKREIPLNILHKKEQEYLSNSSSKLEDFYRIWTMKESFLKMSGDVYRKLDSFYTLPSGENNVSINFKQEKIGEYILSHTL